MSWLSSFIHPGRAYDKAQAQLDKYYNQGQGYLNPYNQNGVNQGNNLTQMINELSNPAALRDKWEKGYQTSDAAKNAQGMATEHGLDAASSMGLMGSAPALSAIQTGTSQIGAEDKQNYLNDLMNKYQSGINASQNMYNTGAGAAGQMGQNAMTMGENTAQTQFGKQNAGGQRFGEMGNSGIKMLMDYLTGGMGTGSFGRGAWSTGGS
jgi:hypothetical protein